MEESIGGLEKGRSAKEGRVKRNFVAAAKKASVICPNIDYGGAGPVLQDFLFSSLVSEVFKTADALYLPEGIDIWKLSLDLFQ